MLIANFEGRTVEVKETVRLADKKYVKIRILRGKPFVSWTHGGWAEEDEKLVEYTRLVNERSTHPVMQFYLEMCRAKRDYDAHPDDLELKRKWREASLKYQKAADYEDELADDEAATRADVRASLRSF